MIILIGCTKDNDLDITSPIDFLNPQNIDSSKIDLYISIMDIQEVSNGQYNNTYETFFFPINPSIKDSLIIVRINNKPVEVKKWQHIWFVNYDYEEGSEYLFDIETDENSYSITVQIPYATSYTTFPENYYPSENAKVDWSLDVNNHNQIAYAFSEFWDDEDWDNDQVSEWYKEISPSNRSFVFPANIVTNFGNNTFYELGIIQFNFNKSERIIVVSISDRHKFYEKQAVETRSRNLLNKFLFELVNLNH